MAAKTVQNVKAIDSSAKKAKRSINDLAGAFTGLFAARVVKQGFEALLKPSLEMEESMTRLAMITNLNKKELGDFRKEAFRVAGQLPFNPQEVLNAMVELQRATGDTSTSYKALGEVATLSMVSMGKLPLERTAKMMAELARTFGFTGEELASKASAIFAASKASGVGLENYEKVMGRLGLAAMRAGQSFDDMLVAFTMSKRIIPSAQRASKMMMMLMAEMTKPGSEAAFKDIGVDLKKADGTLRSLKDIMLQLAVQRKKVGDVQMLDAIAGRGAIGKRSISPVLAMLNTIENGVPGLRAGTDAWSDLEREMANASAQMEKARKLFLAMHGASITLLKDSLQKIAITIGNLILPAVAGLAEGLKVVIEHIDTFIQENPGFSKTLQIFLLVGGAAVGIWALSAALQGAKAIMMLVTSNLLRAGGGATVLNQRLSILNTTLWRNVSAAEGFNAKMGIIGAGTRVLGSQLRGAAVAAKSFAKSMALALAAMEAIRFIGDPGGTADSWAVWLEEASDTWANAITGSKAKRDAKKIAAVFRETFGFSMLLGSQEQKEYAENIVAEREGQKQAVVAEKIAQQKREEHVKSMLSVYRFGSEKLGAVVSRIEDVFGWTPKFLKPDSLTKVMSVISKVTIARGMPNELKGLEVTKRLAVDVQRLIGESQTRQLKQEEYKHVGDSIEAIRAFAGMQYGRTGGRGVKKGHLELLKKDIHDPWKQWQSKANRRASRIVQKLEGGLAPGSGGEKREFPEGYKKHLGGFKATDDPEFLKILQMTHKTPISTMSPGARQAQIDPLQSSLVQSYQNRKGWGDEAERLRTRRDNIRANLRSMPSPEAGDMAGLAGRRAVKSRLEAALAKTGSDMEKAYENIKLWTDETKKIERQLSKFTTQPMRVRIVDMETGAMGIDPIGGRTAPQGG